MFPLIIAALMKAGNSNAIDFNLSGSSGTPIETAYESSDPADSEVVWLIAGNTTGTIVKGEIQSSGHDLGDAASYTSSNPTTDFRIPKDGWTTLYVRLTLDAGDAPDTTTHAVNGTTWHTLTEDSNNIWWIYQHAAPVGSSTGTIKVEIATDSGGTDIVATGYYKATCTVGV